MTIPEPLTPEERPPRRGVILLTMAAVVLSVASAAWWTTRDNDDLPLSTAEAVAELDPDAMAPEGERVRVRVLNATTTSGLARRLTNLARDLGYDVVDYGTESLDRREVTTIVVHTGQTEWARRLARGIGADSIEPSTDTLRYVDLTVLIGTDWKPPASQPFRP